jgi:hypothetical protein
LPSRKSVTMAPWQPGTCLHTWSAGKRIHPSGNCSSRGDSAGPVRKSRSGAAGRWRRRPSCMAGKRWPLGPALYPARSWNLMSRTLGSGRSAQLPRLLPITLRCSFSSATGNWPVTASKDGLRLADSKNFRTTAYVRLRILSERMRVSPVGCWADPGMCLE